jgi:hypothetical protein
MVPVKNGDLWQRVDRAMRFHCVDCRSLRIDPPHRVPLPHGGGQWRRHPQGGVTRQAAPEAADWKPAPRRRVALAPPRRVTRLWRRVLGTFCTLARGRCEVPSPSGRGLG